MHDSDKAFRKILSEYISSMPYAVKEARIYKDANTGGVQLIFRFQMPQGPKSQEDDEYLKLVKITQIIRADEHPLA